MQFYRIKMRYLIEPKNRIYVKGYRFWSFANNMGKNLSDKYGQKLLESAKKIYNGCNKNCFKKSNSKTVEATGHLIGNKIADNLPKKSLSRSQNDDANSEIKEPKKINISRRKKRNYR